MEWSDHGIVVGVRRHGETAVILDVLTSRHGRHNGYVHGGRSRQLRACLQPGNGVDVVWRSRVEDQLGHFTVEPRRQRAARVMASAEALHAVGHLCGLARLLAERETHPSLHDALDALLEEIDHPGLVPPGVARFELGLLTELGFGLDLGRCAVTGRVDDLVYVSPRSARAVSRAAGEPYRDRLLPLPAFLRDAATSGEAPEVGDVLAAFRTLGHFLERSVFAPRGLTLPEPRAAYLAALARRRAAQLARGQASDEVL